MAEPQALFRRAFSNYFSIGQNEMSAKFQDSTDEADSWLLRDDFFYTEFGRPLIIFKKGLTFTFHLLN